MDFSELQAEVEGVFAASGSARARLQALCELMRERVPHYDWFGFYVARRDEQLLDLGPFSGEQTEHVLIPFGRGICGQAADRLRTIVVDDVAAEANYLACSLRVKSEIVVPVLEPGSGEVAGEIDIDSHTAAAFKDADRDFLERLARSVAPAISALRKRGFA